MLAAPHRAATTHRRMVTAILAAICALSLFPAPAGAVFGYVGQFGTHGTGSGQFYGPHGIAIAGGTIYVVDQGNDRVQTFTAAHAYSMQWGVSGTGAGELSYPSGVAVAGGSVWVADTDNSRELQSRRAHGG